jgi:hypothetical protein
VTIDLTTGPAQPDAAGSAPAAPAPPRLRGPHRPAKRRPRPRPRPRPRLRRAAAGLGASLPLLLVLAVQAALSLRLANTAFEDEALVLVSGHQEINVLFHGAAGTPGSAGYFSAAPFLYPVLAAAVDGRFGLEGVRLLSLLLMLGATTLLWSGTRALFGRPAALGAALVFGLAGPTLLLGHFAVYDVPAVLLSAVSLRILVATARRRLWTVLLAVPTTVLSIATSYAAALYLPLLALVAVFSAAAAAEKTTRRGRRLRHLLRGVLFAGAVGAIAEVWLARLGPGYRQGFEATVTGRFGSAGPAFEGAGAIAGDTLRWGAAVLVLGLLGTLAVARRHRARPGDPHRVAPVLLTLTLALSVLAAPAYQLHVHTSQSLQKHMDIGLLFASAAAGIAVSAPLRTAWRARSRYGVLAATALALAGLGAVQSARLFAYWPDSAALVTVLKQAMGRGGGHYLAEAAVVPQYYTAGLPDGARNDWQNTFYFGTVDDSGRYVHGLPAYRRAIAERYFKLIVLSYSETPALDRRIDAPLKAHSGYRLIAVIPTRDAFGRGEYDIWQAEDTTREAQ